MLEFEIQEKHSTWSMSMDHLRTVQIADEVDLETFDFNVVHNNAG